MPGQVTDQSQHTPQNQLFQAQTVKGDQAQLKKQMFRPGLSNPLSTEQNKSLNENFSQGQNYPDSNLIERKHEVERQREEEANRYFQQQHLQKQHQIRQDEQPLFEKVIFGPESLTHYIQEKFQQPQLVQEKEPEFSQETMEKIKQQVEDAFPETHEQKSIWQQAKETLFGTSTDQREHLTRTDEERRDLQQGAQTTEVAQDENKTLIDKTKEKLNQFKDVLLNEQKPHIKEDIIVGQEETPQQLKGDNVKFEPTLEERASETFQNVKESISEAIQMTKETLFGKEEEIPKKIEDEIDQEMMKTRERLFGQEPYQRINE